MPPVTLGIHGPKARAYICHTVYRDNGPEGTPRWGCALPLGPPVPSLGGVCALSAAGTATASVPCLGHCARPNRRISTTCKICIV